MKILIIICFYLISTSTQAESTLMPTPMTTTYLAFGCKAGKIDGNAENARGFCSGAIDAFYSTMTTWCVPHEVTHKEIKEVVIEALLDSSLKKPEKASEFVNFIILKTWPCS